MRPHESADCRCAACQAYDNGLPNEVAGRRTIEFVALNEARVKAWLSTIEGAAFTDIHYDPEEKLFIGRVTYQPPMQRYLSIQTTFHIQQDLRDQDPDLAVAAFLKDLNERQMPETD